MKKTVAFKVMDETYRAIHDLKNSQGFTLREFILLSIIKWIKAQKKLNPALTHYYDRKIRIIQKEFRYILGEKAYER